MNIRYFLLIARVLFLILGSLQEDLLYSAAGSTPIASKLNSINPEIKHTLLCGLKNAIFDNNTLPTAAQILDQISMIYTDEVKHDLVNAICPNVRNPDGSQYPLLHIAAALGDEIVVKVLLDHGAAVNIVDSKKTTPLLAAAEKGHLNAAKLLIERGADIHASNSQKDTALNIAAYKGHPALVQLLIDNKAQVNSIEIKEKRTPLYMAAEQGHTECVRILLENKAWVNQPDYLGFTPLHIASTEGYVEIAHLLIQHGAWINKPNHDGNTPFHLTIGLTYSENIAPITSVGLQRQPTTLQKKLAIANLLIAHNALIDEPNKEGGTPLTAAVYHGFGDMVTLLLNNGADATKKFRGKTLVAIANQEKHPAIARIIIEHNVKQVQSRQAQADAMLLQQQAIADNLAALLIQEEETSPKKLLQTTSQKKKKKRSPKQNNNSSNTSIGSTDTPSADSLKSNTLAGIGDDYNEDEDLSEHSNELDYTTTIAISDSSETTSYCEASYAFEDMDTLYLDKNGNLTINIKFLQSSSSSRGHRVAFRHDAVAQLKQIAAMDADEERQSYFSFQKSNVTGGGLLPLDWRVHQFLAALVRESSDTLTASTIDHTCTTKLIINALFCGSIYLQLSTEEPNATPTLLVVAPIERTTSKNLEPLLKGQSTKNFITLTFSIDESSSSSEIKRCYHCCAQSNHPGVIMADTGKTKYLLQPVEIKADMSPYTGKLKLQFKSVQQYSNARQQLLAQQRAL